MILDPNLQIVVFHVGILVWVLGPGLALGVVLSVGVGVVLLLGLGFDRVLALVLVVG